MSIELDPIKYEIFERSLASTLEEGRQAVGMVTVVLDPVVGVNVAVRPEV